MWDMFTPNGGGYIPPEVRYEFAGRTSSASQSSASYANAGQPSVNYVEKTFEYPLKASTGSGWLPFVFERELTVDLSAFASSEYQITDAVLYVRVDSQCWASDGITVIINGNTVYDGLDRTFQGSIKDAIIAGVNSIRVVLKPNPATVAMFAPSLYCREGAQLTGKLMVTVRKYLSAGETENDAENKLRDAFRSSAINSAQLQGYTVTSVKETPQGLQLNVVDLSGAIKPLNFNIGGIGMGIAVLFFMFFIMLLILLLVRR